MADFQILLQFDAAVNFATFIINLPHLNHVTALLYEIQNIKNS